MKLREESYQSHLMEQLEWGSFSYSCRFVNDEYYIQQRLVRLQLLSESISGEELARVTS